MIDRFYSFWQTCCRLYNLLSILFSKLWPQSNLASHTDCCDAGISRPRIGHSPAILSYRGHIQFCHHIAIDCGLRSAGRSLCSFCRRLAARRSSRPSFGTELAPFFIRPCARKRRSLTAAVEIPNLVATSSVESSITFRRTQTLRSSAGSSAILSAMMRNRSLRAYDASGFSRQARDSNLWDSFRTGSHSSSGTNLPDCLRRTKSIAEFAVIRINQERKSPFVTSCGPVIQGSFVKEFHVD